jgi:hypothetical protein
MLVYLCRPLFCRNLFGYRITCSLCLSMFLWCCCDAIYGCLLAMHLVVDSFCSIGRRVVLCTFVFIAISIQYLIFYFLFVWQHPGCWFHCSFSSQRYILNYTLCCYIPVVCNLYVWCFPWDCLCGLVVRVPGYRSRDPEFDPGATRYSEK